jgi:hypothetical protein
VTAAGASALEWDDDGELGPELSRRRLWLWLWVLAVVLYFAWEAVAYRGLFSIIAEWQFNHFGQDLPTFIFGALTTIFAWPALYLFRRRVLVEEEPDDDGEPADPDAIDLPAVRRDAEAAEDAARDYMHFLFGFTVAMILAAVVALGWTLLLPKLEGPTRTIAVTGALPAEGPAQMVGTVQYGRIASFSRGILFLRRTALYAPIISPKDASGEIRYFIEFLPSERGDISNGATVSSRRGILVRNDLPGALQRLYQYLGYITSERYYVLYASSETIRWPYYLVAIQFAIGGVGFLVCALFQRRRAERLARDARILRIRERRLTLTPA